MAVKKQDDTLPICIDPTDKAIKRIHYPLPTIEEVTARMLSSQYFTVLDVQKGFWQINLSKVAN